MVFYFMIIVPLSVHFCAWQLLIKTYDDDVDYCFKTMFQRNYRYFAFLFSCSAEAVTKHLSKFYQAVQNYVKDYLNHTTKQKSIPYVIITKEIVGSRV